MVEFRPERLLVWSGKVPTNEDVIRKLVDEAYLAAKIMIRTHLIADKMVFVKLALAIQAQGYDLVWFKHRNTVGATRQGCSDIHPSIERSNNVGI